MGELEQAVMETLWDLDGPSSATVGQWPPVHEPLQGPTAATSPTRP